MPFVSSAGVAGISEQVSTVKVGEGGRVFRVVLGPLLPPLPNSKFSSVFLLI